MSNATRRQGRKYLCWNFRGHSRAPKGSRKKFPTGIGGQATLKRRIFEASCGLKKVVTRVSHKGVLLDQPRSGKTNRIHQLDTCRKAGNRDNSGNQSSSVPRPKVEWSRRPHTKSLRSEHCGRQRRCTARNTRSPEETRRRTKTGRNSGTISPNKIKNSHTQPAECEFSGGQFCFVVQTFDNSRGNCTFGPKPVENELAVVP